MGVATSTTKMSGVCTHPLDINDFNTVYKECQSLSAHWNGIGMYLNAPKNQMDIIVADCRRSADRLSALLDVWLRRWSPDQSIPSWSILCKAISMVDRGCADRIAAKYKSRGCSQCSVGPIPVTQAPSKEVRSQRQVRETVANNIPIQTPSNRGTTTPTNNSYKISTRHMAYVDSTASNSNNAPITAAVFKKHYATLYSILNTSDDAFDRLTIELYSMGFISQHSKVSFKRKRDVSGLLDHILMMNPSLIESVVNIMYSIDLLCDIAIQMRATIPHNNANDCSISSTIEQSHSSSNNKHIHSLEPTIDPDPTTIDPYPVPAGGQPSCVLSSDSEEETTDSPSDSPSPLPKDKNKQQVPLDNRGSTWKTIIAIVLVVFGVAIAMLIQRAYS